MLDYLRNGHMFMLDAMNVVLNNATRVQNISSHTVEICTYMARSVRTVQLSTRRCVWTSWNVFVHISALKKIQAGSDSIQSFFGKGWILLQDCAASSCWIQCSSNKTDLNYNHSAKHHVPDLNKHILFWKCIGAIDGAYVRAILPRDKRVDFISRKEISTQNVFSACNFNLCSRVWRGWCMIHAYWCVWYTVRNLIFPCLLQENIIL